MARKQGSETPQVGVPATALVTASFLSGAMLSISAIAVRVFLDTGTESAPLLKQWTSLYHYGHAYMPAVSIAATGLYAYAALRKRALKREQWLLYAAAGVTTITMVPFTWAIMVPTNNAIFRLEALASAKASAVDVITVKELLVRWAWLHVVRSVFPLVGAIVGLIGVLKELGV